MSESSQSDSLKYRIALDSMRFHVHLNFPQTLLESGAEMSLGAHSCIDS